MKRSFYLFMFVSGMWLFSSCESKDFLDETETTDLDEETVFSDSTYTTAFLTDIYIDIGFASNFDRFNDGAIIFPTPSGGMQTACDEGEPRQLSSITTDIQFATGTVNPVIINSDSWSTPYVNIRKVNQFLKHVDDSPLSSTRIKRFKAEARFLRAWYYSVLLKHYGGVPIIGDTVYAADDEVNTVRNTYAECVDYIVSECDIAAKDLSTLPTGSNRGRIGSVTCNALKSRVLLYAASPLFNGSDFATEYPELKELVGYTEYDKKRWELARDAALAVISTGACSLYIDNDEEPGFGFYAQFLAYDHVSDGGYNGIILEHKRDDSNWKEALFQPPSRGGGGGGWPYQELVDAFPMKNGLAITDPNSGYDPNNPYENRDPRFANSITYDQAGVMDGATEDVPVNIFLGYYNGSSEGEDAVYTGTPTGYYFRKSQHRGCAANYWITVDQSRPIIRYAEILLNYAEAQNEFAGPSSEIYDALISIRERAGIDAGDGGMYGIPENMTQDEMREFIHAERQIELAVEGHRFWDVRRWMIADETENKTMHGMEIFRINDEATYKIFEVRTRVFRKAMYLWAIPYSEVSKSPLLKQNPYYDNN